MRKVFWIKKLLLATSKNAAVSCAASGNIIQVCPLPTSEKINETSPGHYSEILIRLVAPVRTSVGLQGALSGPVEADEGNERQVLGTQLHRKFSLQPPCLGTVGHKKGFIVKIRGSGRHPGAQYKIGVGADSSLIPHMRPEPPAGHALEGIAHGYAGKPVSGQTVIQRQIKFLNDGMGIPSIHIFITHPGGVIIIPGKIPKQAAVNQVPAKRRGQVLQ